MDDPISALDANVRKKIFNEVFKGLLKHKTRILVTHSIDFVHLADKIVIMKEGRIKAQGSFEELKDDKYMNVDLSVITYVSMFLFLRSV